MRRRPALTNAGNDNVFGGGVDELVNIGPDLQAMNSSGTPTQQEKKGVARGDRPPTARFAHARAACAAG